MEEVHCLPEYIGKCKVTAAYNFEKAYDKCLWNAVLLGMINQKVYEKCIGVEDKLTSADVICVAAEVYNSDRQLSIIQILSATATAATAVQNPSLSEIHVVKAKHSKKGSATENRNSGHPDQIKHKSCYYCGVTTSHPKKDCPAKETKCYKCGKKGYFKSIYNSKQGVKDKGKLKDSRKSKPPEVYH